ncbi:caprin-2 [Pholidichthys leucotaenia]
MVQLPPSPVQDATHPPGSSEEEEEEEENKRGMADTVEGDPKMSLMPSGAGALQLSLEVSTVYHSYETYIEDGLICLKHKVRNLEKKKRRLEDLKRRLELGEVLNKDQLAAVEKYEEVLHHLEFAKELHRTLDSLTENLLSGQKKAVKKEQMMRLDAERRRLATVLQVQYILFSLQQEHIQEDLLAGHNQAPRVPAQKLHSLSQLATILGVERDHRLSLKDQMDQAALFYLDLLEGTDKPVAGSSFKLLKEELSQLLNCRYFSCLPPPPPKKSPEITLCSTSHSTRLMTKPKEFFNSLYVTEIETCPNQAWKEDFKTVREQEPADCWDMVSPNESSPPRSKVHKPWKATMIPSVSSKKQSVCKQRKERKGTGEQNTKESVLMDVPAEGFSCPSTPPKDPVLRKQLLEDLMTKIHGSFSFMQESLIDGSGSPSSDHPRPRRHSSGSLSPLVKLGFSSTADMVIGKDTFKENSTPLSANLMERKASLTNGKRETCDSKLSPQHLPHEPLQSADGKEFSSPPLFHRESTVSVCVEKSSRPQTPVTDSGKQSPCNGVVSGSSTPPQGRSFSTPPTRRTLSSAQFQNIQTVFKISPSLPQRGELNYEPDSEPRFSTASTQTPPDFAVSDDELQAVYQSDISLDNGGQMFLSPGQSGGGHPSQMYYTRGSVRDVTRGGKGLGQSVRSYGCHKGFYIPHSDPRESHPPLYAVRELGYRHNSRRGGRRNSSAAWSDSSQVSSPDRDGAFTGVDSGHGDSMSVSTLEVPMTPHGHDHPALMPMSLYSLSQPLRVAFTASRTANFAPGNLDQPIVFDQLHSNLGEMYDTHIGRFTCPVNGTYVFIFHILKLAINVPLYINLMRNEEIMVSAYANDGAPDHETASNHAILPLFQGDQVWLRLHRGAIYGSTWKYSTFSGFLLYQD